VGKIIWSLTLILLLVLLSSEWTKGAAKEQTVTIILGEQSLSPAAVRLQAGVAVQMKLVNSGKLKHEFMVYLVPKVKVSDWDEYVMTHSYFRDIAEVEGEFEGIGAVSGTRVFAWQPSRFCRTSDEDGVDRHMNQVSAAQAASRFGFRPASLFSIEMFLPSTHPRFRNLSRNATRLGVMPSRGEDDRSGRPCLIGAPWR
jgi:hypothetical protein